jgi:hypothetical protein
MKYKRSALIVAFWLFLVILTYLDSLGELGMVDYSNGETLRNSSLARIMFVDIGVLATFAAYWVYRSSKVSIRVGFAIATLFVGSFALLPYIAYYYYLIDSGQSDKVRDTFLISK